ncbi:hypothetical protein COLO4_18715 [Corchorus olitorius]|uniref:DDT domain-containing protein n=1 Tax=Corchorus olitorius TaxID=93759 RepID=A0A1R3J861_9ROSI|nr:hypothetical protein COLO4_18715 [Corchorus olitorius]
MPGQAMPTVKGKVTGDDSLSTLDDSSSDSEVAKLRGRWELASVLNFLNVFEPVIGIDMKLTAEDIELGLVKPNASIAQLHIKLLKGIPPVSKLLNGSDAWVTALCKKLATWWPWVAEGEIPITAHNGEEISRYKELDPTSRLILLKALCEIRADQVDTVSYINNALKSKKEISCFRKEKIGRNGNVSYWYDGNTVFGYRLYREINRTESQTKAKGKACSKVPIFCSRWETLAVDLEEFRGVADELLASKVASEVFIGQTIDSDAIPDVKKFQQKKERALKQKKKQEMILNGLRSSSGAGVTRSCRIRRPISYTFDEYDRAIDDAIELTKRRKTVEEQKQEQRLVRQKFASNGVSVVEGAVSSGSSEGKGDSIVSETEDDKLQQAGDDSCEEDADCSSMKDGDDNDGSDSGFSADEKENLVYKNHEKDMSRGSSWSDIPIHPDAGTGDLGGTKNRSRQRPVINSALDSVVLDSEDDISGEHTNSGVSSPENVPRVADSEEASDSE